MIDRIEALEGMFLPGVEALALSREADLWHITVEDKKRGGRRSLYADHLILATEPPAAERLLISRSLDLPTESSSSAQTNSSLSVNGEGMETARHTEGVARSGRVRLEVGGEVKETSTAHIRYPEALPNTAVRLWFDRAPASGAPAGMFTGDFPMDNFFWLHRLYDSFKPWHEATGGAVLEVHLYGKGNIFDLTDEALIIRVVSEVTLAFPALRGHFVHGSVRRNSRTQTLFEIPTLDSLHVETPWPHLYACGD